MRRRLADDSTARSLADALLFARICTFAAAVPLLVRLPLPRVQTLLSSPPRRVAEPDPDEVRRIVAHVAFAQRALAPVVRPGCLTRGLTLYRFLGRAGLDLSLCFGLADPGGDPKGHCWLVRDDEPFLETVDPRPVFTETYRMVRR